MSLTPRQIHDARKMFMGNPVLGPDDVAAHLKLQTKDVRKVAEEQHWEIVRTENMQRKKLDLPSDDMKLGVTDLGKLRQRIHNKIDGYFEKHGDRIIRFSIDTELNGGKDEVPNRALVIELVSVETGLSEDL